MARFEEAMQRFWLRDLHKVRGSPREDMKAWLQKREYIITAPQTATVFSLQVIREADFLSSIAYDSNRMACAAIETMVAITQIKTLPRSTAWLIIQAYYAAFFAAHALLRMFGVVCFQIDATTAAALARVANSQGSLPPTGFEKGFYVCTYDSTTKLLSFTKSAAASRGSHEILWEVFIQKLRQMAHELLAASSIYTPFAVKLTELETILCERGHATGGSLSNIRNSVNYRHEFGTWFPYRGVSLSPEQLFKLAGKWTAYPVTIETSPSSRNVLGMQLAASVFIVSVCRLVAIDMGNKCPAGRSFQSYGCVALMQRIQQ
jgi:hypothetical protein